MITSAVTDKSDAERIARERSNSGVTAVGSRGSSGQWYVNYTHRDAHKGHGARLFSEQVGVDLDLVMAIGDGLNDLHMFEAVGLPVAMGQASDDIIRMARHVTGSLEQDGVAQAIERFVL